ncbi:MAG: hypothetical protein KGJ58_04675 [Patescibacteria group bacterium]|nr:hypothetical protein [Patescibacteria group bacterium]
MIKITELEKKFDFLLEKLGIECGSLYAWDTVENYLSWKDDNKRLVFSGTTRRIERKVDLLLDYLGLEVFDEMTVTQKGGIRKLNKEQLAKKRQNESETVEP